MKIKASDLPCFEFSFDLYRFLFMMLNLSVLQLQSNKPYFSCLPCFKIVNGFEILIVKQNSGQHTAIYYKVSRIFEIFLGYIICNIVLEHSIISNISRSHYLLYCAGTFDAIHHRGASFSALFLFYSPYFLSHWREVL